MIPPLPNFYIRLQGLFSTLLPQLESHKNRQVVFDIIHNSFVIVYLSMSFKTPIPSPLQRPGDPLTGSRIPLPGRSNRAHTSSTSRERFLLCVLPSSQNDRRLDSAPRVSTKTFLVVGVHLRQNSFTVFPYLDDRLLVAKPHQEACELTSSVLQLLSSLEVCVIGKFCPHSNANYRLHKGRP